MQNINWDFILKVLYALVVIVVFGYFGYKYVVWNDHRNVVLEQQAVVYEACVKKEYKTDPASYYNLHGEYPKCSE